MPRVDLHPLPNRAPATTAPVRTAYACLSRYRCRGQPSARAIGTGARHDSWQLSTDKEPMLTSVRGNLPPKPTRNAESPDLTRVSALVATNRSADNNLVAINRRNSEP